MATSNSNFGARMAAAREAKKGARLTPVKAMPARKRAPAATMHPIKKGK